MTKRTVDELLFQACIHAEQDRLSFAEANHPCSIEAIEAQELAQQLHDYRMQRWGQTRFETAISKARVVALTSLQNRGQK